MREFPARPKLLALGHHRYRLDEPYQYRWTHDGHQHKLIIYEGFETDLASTPKLVWGIISGQDLGLGPPLFHDALYRSGGSLSAYNIGLSERTEKVLSNCDAKVWQETDPWTRWHADRLFCRQMREVDVAMWKRRSSYYAVRIFGCLAWGASTSP